MFINQRDYNQRQRELNVKTLHFPRTEIQRGALSKKNKNKPKIKLRTTWLIKPKILLVADYLGSRHMVKTFFQFLCI